MKLINSALAEKNVKLAELSPELQARVAELRKAMFDYNVACEDYEALEEAEQDEATGQKLDGMRDSLSEMENQLAEDIKAFEVVAAPPPPPPPVVKKEGKEDSSLGWLIFGIVALGVTFGAVNILKKKG